jgi:predicted DNA-binding protein (MmcQ/YjbR family)
MHLETVRSYCLSFPHVTEEFPFDQSTLAFKVGGKIFALVDVDGFNFLNLKCDPLKAIELRERYEAVRPGYHMNKKHWNSVYIHSDLPEKQLIDLISDSYNLVYSSLPKKIKNELPLG